LILRWADMHIPTMKASVPGAQTPKYQKATIRGPYLVG
jgi:hypothetical protein